MQPAVGVSAACFAEGNAVVYLKGSKTERREAVTHFKKLQELDGAPFWTVCHTSGVPILHTANP